MPNKMIGVRGGPLCRHMKCLILLSALLFSAIAASLGQDIKNVLIGKNLTITCLSTNETVTWKHNNESIDLENKRYKLNIVFNDTSNNQFKHHLLIENVDFSDQGVYSCHPAINETYESIEIRPVIEPRIVGKNDRIVKQKISHAVTLYCLIEVYPIDESFRSNLKWLKDDNSYSFLDQFASIIEINATHVNYTLDFTEVYKKENGSYACVINSNDDTKTIRNEVALLVLDVPQVSIDFAKAVGKSKIFLNWTVNDGNDPVQKYFIQYTEEKSPAFTYYKNVIGGKNTSYILENFKANTSYLLRMSAKNSIGEGTAHQFHLAVRTLSKDPVFIPKVETTGSTSSTITIGWDPPPPDLIDYIQYYEVVVAEAGEPPKIIEEAIYQQNSRNLPYMFDNLKTATEYEFRVRACSDLTKTCGNWSQVVNGTTMDGVASPPLNLHVNCQPATISRVNTVVVTWRPPEIPNGKVVSYLIHLEGLSTYKLNGKLHNETWGPKIRRVDEPHHKTVFEGVHLNTNYTITVSAITRHRKTGESAVSKCTMPVAVPETISRVMWTKVGMPHNKCVFKLLLPKISERNGPICSYRVFLIRMENNNELPPPNQLKVLTYDEVHSPNNSVGGAYVAEMFPGYSSRSEILLGDGKRYLDNADIAAQDEFCFRCLQGHPLRKLKIDRQHAATIPTIESPLESSQRVQLNKASNLTEDALKILNNRKRRRRKRSPKFSFSDSSQSLLDSDRDRNMNMHLNGPSAASKIQSLNILAHSTNNISTFDEEIFDGEIDMTSNYTGFLEVIVRDRNTVLAAYSSYFDVMTPGTVAEQFHLTNSETSAILSLVLKILGALIGVALVILVLLCCFHRYNRKNSGDGEDVKSLSDYLGRLFGGGSTNHRHFTSSGNMKATDVGPINRADLCTAYTNRHKDTDYGFLREYEMLPIRFSDRTTKNSEMKENATKNRYPDIKSYDQTRVKLAQINGIQGSDYINANFVIGYKERKKFICAQGPMETTVNDFWRMIWEQHLEIIVMLTNLEEYNKSKCAKYWPEKILDTKQFGEITVKFVSERKSGDYLVRNLDVFRRNFSNDDEEERRQITQYHYLVWKDFMAPEHPQGIIKFIRHINAVYSVQRGPILVHCSAGVGRTGTLVALDSLMQQLEEEDQVSIFNTVCDLRHQRNFLVQSLKQYIFIYRALLETAHFGNTELSLASLSISIENLKTKLNDKDKCKLEIEFDKLMAVIDETSKSSSVANNEANVPKNRSEAVLPFDRNRVILAPIPSRENSTYINASFIEGYDNNYSYIITQDPMEQTIGDFWRMVSEQSISTIVMISEIGDGPRKCPRYWADDEIQYDHILVKYMQSESCPYYTRREFNVRNCKIDDTIKVTQLQYNGWPTVDGEVPEVCRGIIELVDQAQIQHNKEKNLGCRSPVAVHCSLGTDRSSIFVAMSILVQQLRTEKCVDVCSIVRKLRTQRPRLINTYAQYEFLHRAIANYADLHKLSMESPSEC